MTRRSPTNRRYTAELKLRAVTDYLDGKGSQRAVCERYGIASHTQLQSWIRIYLEKGELPQNSAVSGHVYSVRGRNTTLAERAEAVAFCFENGRDMGLTSEHFNVSYQQITSWVKKYENYGIEGLIDRRGRGAHKEVRSELQRLDALIRSAKDKLNCFD